MTTLLAIRFILHCCGGLAHTSLNNCFNSDTKPSFPFSHWLIDSMVFLIVLLNNSKSQTYLFTWNFQLENIIHGSINLVKFSRSWRSKTSTNHHYKMFYLFRNSMLTLYPMQQYAHLPNRYTFVLSREYFANSFKLWFSKCEMRLCPPFGQQRLLPWNFPIDEVWESWLLTQR